jgi:subtilisin family serine protease
MAAVLAFALSPASQAARTPQAIDIDAGPLVPTRAKAQAGKLPDSHVLIVLSEPAAVMAYPSAPSSVGSSSSSTSSAAATATRTQIAKNLAQQTALLSAMNAAGIKYTKIYQVQRVMNGVAVIVPSSQVPALRKLPNVQAVRTIVPSVPTSNSSTSFVGANKVWQGIPAATADGTGIKIGIIDSGIDYQHANFGGSGLLAAYQSNDRVTITPALFPTAKVVGGTDLAGDAYDAAAPAGDPALIPHPDPNPTDCGGHGSHVAGTAGGFGVTTTGTTFAGPYDSATINALRIQPGIAPKSSLYAIRVFGCDGSTDLVVQAIDYALDPNGDGDLSDHLDVINMSLGSSAGGLSNLDTDASNNASLSGMVVVASAGNAADTYMVLGSPSSATRAISVAASWDGGETAGNVNVSSPPSIAGNFFSVPASFGPPIPSSPLSGTLVYAVPNNGCSVPANVAGKIAVIDRGTCSFQPKVYNAQLGGAIAVIVVDNRPETPITMGPDGVTTNPSIPSVMISQADGAIIKTQIAGTVLASIGGVPGGDLVTSFSSRGPVNDLPITMKPDITAPGLNIVSTQTGMTCMTGVGCITPTADGYDPGNNSLTISGTSMAAPQVAGMVALLKQLHPTLSPEEIKALAMNGSLHDLTTAPGGSGLRYGAGRVGAGRIDAVASANLPVAAFGADGSGTVGVTFPGQVTGTTSVTRKVRIKNYGSAVQSLTLGFDTVVNNPGVSFSLPAGNSLTLLGHQTLEIDVRMTGNANQITNNFDPTIYLQQGTTFSTAAYRFWVPEETAYLTLSTGAGTIARLPLYVAPVGDAAMSGGSTVPTGGLASGSTAIPLTGTGICTGTLTAGPGCSGAFPVDIESLVTPFELQASNPRDTTIPAQNNVRHVGVSAGGGVLNFGVALWGATPVPQLDADVEITLVTAAGAPLYTLYPYLGVEPNNGYPTNVYLTGVYSYASGTTSLYYYQNGFPSNVVDTRVFQNDVFMMAAPLANIGAPTGKIYYYVDSFNGDGFQEELGPFTFNIGAPGVDFGGGVLFDDLPGATIPVNFNVANLTANASLGALLLHHHNKPGSTAEVLTVPPVTVVPPVLVGAASRRVHSAAGPFDLVLAATPLNPTTEPRNGPTQTIVFTFNKPVTAGTATVTEGTATVGSTTFSGSEMIVNLTGVTDIQYVTLAVSAVVAADGGTGGAGSVRAGFLAGDVTQNRQVTVGDVGLVNSVLLQPVTASNYLKDVNVSGTITVADKGSVNGNLLHQLPTP